ncbi:hypothetical protein ACFFQW_45010 [Umezawaea endophytica]|uniref:Uncharacterized protein n=1 Tax=Umezawaea endophytica TaxID=1654476 RepID=A0A9X3AGC0_9PSEU|nr:hypothetical protein [Umezawaea endophytica]MCS7479942.1 hypothetical protein [Umezawaea endophytica]
MLTSSRELLGFRTLALLPLVLFLPVVVSFAVDPGALWPEYIGVLFHLSVLFLVSRMDAPPWGRAAGFGWITVDILAGVLAINEVHSDLVLAVRLGGHVLAGVWIITVSVLARTWPIRVVGTITGLWLSAYSFVGNILPTTALAPASVLTLVWYGLLAFTYEQR